MLMTSLLLCRNGIGFQKKSQNIVDIIYGWSLREFRVIIRLCVHLIAWCYREAGSRWKPTRYFAAGNQTYAIYYGTGNKNYTVTKATFKPKTSNEIDQVIEIDHVFSAQKWFMDKALSVVTRAWPDFDVSEFPSGSDWLGWLNWIW